MYNDFVERRPSAAKELEDRLNASNTERPTADRNREEARNSTTNLSHVGDKNALDQQSTTNRIDVQRSPNTYNPCPQHKAEGSTVIEYDPECRWLLVCPRTKKRPTSLSQLNVCSTSSDKVVYKELRASYLKLKSRWVQKFSLRRAKSIRFVQVRRYANTIHFFLPSKLNGEA